MELNDVTLVCASTFKHRHTENALIKTINKIDFGEVLYFTDKLIDKSLENYVDVHFINEYLSINDYSDFILYTLPQFIKTSHVLIIQWDGYVIRPRSWRHEFLTYDYIGAPWYFRENDLSFARDNFGRWIDVGNGGFSLRSKKLMDYVALKRHNIPDWFRSENEDGIICVALRQELLESGFRFADRSVAKSFSIDAGLRNKEFWMTKSFGFHGKRMLSKAKFMEFLNVK